MQDGDQAGDYRRCLMRATASTSLLVTEPRELGMPLLVLPLFPSLLPKLQRLFLKHIYDMVAKPVRAGITSSVLPFILPFAHRYYDAHPT